jgi:transposase
LTGHGNAYLTAILGNAAAGASKTTRFLGEKYRRIARRRGSKRAIVAVGRSILVIAWHLLSDPDARFYDLGPGYYAARTDPERRKRSHIRQLEALGYKVTLEPAALPALNPNPAPLNAPPGAAACPLTHRFSD